MGITANFIKLRSSGTPKVGEWNIGYDSALAKAKKEYKYIVTAWSNGDACSYCIKSEQCMLTAEFKEWMTKTDAYFVFQYSGDKDKGNVLHDWIFTKGKVKKYPGFRITLYDAKGNIVVDKTFDGNTLRGNKINAYGVKEMIKNLDVIISKKPAQVADTQTPSKPTTPAKPTTTAYVVRLNEKLTVKKVNSILDAIDKNDGYCPCQPKGDGTKCHCKDFINDKKIGEPCICKIYVKQKKVTTQNPTKKLACKRKK